MFLEKKTLYMKNEKMKTEYIWKRKQKINKNKEKMG